MMTTIGELRAKALAEWQALEQESRPHVRIGTDTSGQASGAMDTVAAFQRQQAKHNLDLVITQVGSIGTCYLEPVVIINKPGQPARSRWSIEFASLAWASCGVQAFSDHLLFRPNLSESTSLASSDDFRRGEDFQRDRQLVSG